MIPLVDSDLITYRVGFTTQDDDEGIASWRTDDLMRRIIGDAKEYRAFLTSNDKSNFRFQLFPEYKAHRTKPKPKHYDHIRRHLKLVWAAEEVFEQEADDALAQAQTKDTIICTIDKDLDQIAGWHYNFVKEEKYKINEVGALRSFYWQCLVGDKPVDNIEGCPGIGKVKATRILEGCETEKEMLEEIVQKYQKAYQGSDHDWVEKLLLAGNLLWIRRILGQPWVLQNGEVVSKDVLENYLQNLESSSSMSQKSTIIQFPSNTGNT